MMPNYRRLPCVVNDAREKWDVPAEAKRALADLICWRAGFVNEYLVDAVAKVCWPDQHAATDEG